MNRTLSGLAVAAAVGTGLLTVTGCGGQKWTEEQKETYNLVTQKGGQTLGYSPASGVKLIEDGGFAFKDLNRNGVLDPYEDWRLTPEERAKDLLTSSMRHPN